MKKKAKEFKIGDSIKIAGKKCTVKNIEISEVAGKGSKITKQDSRKCRIEAETSEGEIVVIIRPESYPLDF